MGQTDFLDYPHVPRLLCFSTPGVNSIEVYMWAKGHLNSNNNSGNRTYIVYNFYPDQGNRYRAGFWKELNKPKLPGQRQSN